MRFKDSLKLNHLKIRSLGCVLYELLNLKQAFPKGSTRRIPRSIDNAVGQYSSIFSKILSKYIIFNK